MITNLDLTIISLYIVIVFIAAVGFAFKRGVDGFLVNNRSTNLFFLVSSIVSTNIGAGFFLTVAAEAYNTGISFGISIALVSTATVLVFAVVSERIKFLTDASNVRTVPDLLAKKYKSPATGVVASLITLFGYLFVTALQFVGIGAVGSVITGFDFEKILLFAGIMTVVYSSIGGIRSDLIADVMSFIILVVTLSLLVPTISINDRVDISTLPDAKFNIFAFSGPSFFFLSILLAAVSAFMFMELWQRVFAAKSPKTARQAFLLSALIQPIFIGVAVYLGLSASAIYPNIDKNTAIFKLMVDYLPPGLLGLGLVSILAILMTTVNSLVVVGGSTLYNDLLVRLIRSKNDAYHMNLLRAMTVTFGGFALYLAFAFPDLVKLLLMGAFVMLPMCPAIIWSLFGKNLTAKGAIASMIAGLIVTFSLAPLMPETAFGPGFLVSLIIIIFTHVKNWQRRSGGDSHVE